MSCHGFFWKVNGVLRFERLIVEINFYIGKTSRKLNKRIYGKKAEIKTANTPNCFVSHNI